MYYVFYLDVGTELEIDTVDISMKVMKKKMTDMTADANNNSSSSSCWKSSAVDVELPDQMSLLGSDAAITVSFTTFKNLGTSCISKIYRLSHSSGLTGPYKYEKRMTRQLSWDTLYIQY